MTGTPWTASVASKLGFPLQAEYQVNYLKKYKNKNKKTSIVQAQDRVQVLRHSLRVNTLIISRAPFPAMKWGVDM